MPTLELKVPDHLKVIFDSTRYLAVKNTRDDTPRDLLLAWLVSAFDGVWISEEPHKARQALQDKFFMYPYLKFENFKFCRPKDLPYEDFSRCVVESDTDAMDWVNHRVSGQIRVLEPANIPVPVSTIEALNLPLERRIELLKEVREGKNKQFEEYDLIASISRESFHCFIAEFWDTIIAEPFIGNWHIKYLADELQHVAEQVFNWQPREYDLIINVSPGSTKSTLCSVMFPAWCWTRMPSSRFLGGSYADKLAMDLSRKNRDIVISPKYKRAFPDITLRKDQAAKSFFVNTRGGSRYSFGTMGTVTGMHSHFIMIDDPLNPEKAVSEIELEKANRVMSETLFTRKVDKAITPTILIMQRLHQNDPTQHMLNTYENVKHICLPAEDGDNVKPPSVRKFYRGGLMDPIRLSKKILKSNFKALGEFSYAGQFLQRPVPRGGAMFKPGRITFDVAPRHWKTKIRYWDKAGTQGGGAYTAGVLMGKDTQDRIWILDVVRGQWGMEEREATIKNTAVMDGHAVMIWIEQEPGSGGKDQALYTVKNLMGYRVQADAVGSSAGNKIVRAGPYADQMNGGNVYMVRADWNKPYIDEHKFFPASKYKDQVDASSGAFNKISKGEIRVGAL